MTQHPHSKLVTSPGLLQQDPPKQPTPAPALPRGDQRRNGWPQRGVPGRNDPRRGGSVPRPAVMPRRPGHR